MCINDYGVYLDDISSDELNLSALLQPVVDFY